MPLSDPSLIYSNCNLLFHVFVRWIGLYSFCPFHRMALQSMTDTVSCLKCDLILCAAKRNQALGSLATTLLHVIFEHGVQWQIYHIHNTRSKIHQLLSRSLCPLPEAPVWAKEISCMTYFSQVNHKALSAVGLFPQMSNSVVSLAGLHYKQQQLQVIPVLQLWIWFFCQQQKPGGRKEELRLEIHPHGYALLCLVPVPYSVQSSCNSNESDQKTYPALSHSLNT